MRAITFGVFDMLHLGHILLFKNIKDLGCELTVAVQADEVVKEYKPDAELVYNTEQRVFMVSCIKYVDKVVVYHHVDRDIKQFDFDVFALGPDQGHKGFVNAKEWCYANRKHVIVIPRTEGISSSYLRDLS